MAEVSEIKRLLKKRATIKAQITSFQYFLTEQSEAERIDPTRISMRVQKIQNTFSTFDGISDALDELDDENDHTSERISIEERYIDALSQAENLLANTRVSRIATTHTAESNNSDAQINPLPSRMPRLKLPEASLPKFDGKYEEWLSFKDSFLAMIGNRSELSSVEKLQYLKASLTGDAARKLNTFTITNENYERAWNVLISSYEDKRLIIARHLSLLIRLPLQKRETASGLIRLADETQQHVLSLQSLNVNVGDETVVQLVVEKLSRNTRQKWDEGLKRNVFPKSDELIEFLYATASRISQWENESHRVKGKTGSNSPSHQNKGAKTFVTTVSKKCPACSGDPHPLYRCEKFREFSVPRRLKIVQDAGLCLNCLRLHSAKTCKFRNCPHCNEQHNSLLHQNRDETQTQN